MKNIHPQIQKYIMSEISLASKLDEHSWDEQSHQKCPGDNISMGNDWQLLSSMKQRTSLVIFCKTL